MVSTFTPNKNIEQPAHNDFVNSWDVPVNADWSSIDKAFGNSTLLNATGASGNVTLTTTQYVPLQLFVAGAPIADTTYVVPTGVGGQWIFANATTGGFNIGIKSNAGGTTIVCPAGQNTLVSCDGSSTGMRLSITTTPPAAGSNSWVQFNAAGILGASAGLAWNGTVLGTTGLAVSGNTVLGANAGSSLTLAGTAVVVPNNLALNTNQFFINSTTGNIGVGTIVPGSLFTVAGNIESTSGGFKFPDATVQVTAAGSSVRLTGCVLPFAGPTAPAGSLLCNGQAVSRITFAALFAIIGTTYGAGNGSTTFNVPDLRGTVPAGLDNMGGVASAGRLSSVMSSLILGGTLSNNAIQSATVSGGCNINGSTGGSLSVSTTSFSMDGENNDLGGVATGGGSTAAAAPHTHANVFSSGATSGSLFVAGSGSISGGTSAFGIAQSTIVMNYIIIT